MTFERKPRTLLAVALVGQVYLCAICGFAANAHDVPETCLVEFEEAKELRVAGNESRALEIFRELRNKCPGSFSVAFECGRTLAMLQEYAQAAEVLDEAIAIKANSTDNLDATVYNVRGYVSVMLAEYEKALTYFQRGLQDPAYESLPDHTKMKLNNNAGFVLFSLERYEEATEFLLVAVGLGSELARENLEKVSSTLKAREAEDEDVRGIFAPIVSSVKAESHLPNELKQISEQLGVDQSELHVFKRSNGWYAITHGSNYSYPTAKRIMSEARAKGISDAYTASTVPWEASSESVESVSETRRQ